jgi:hypothetical protein
MTRSMKWASIVVSALSCFALPANAGYDTTRRESGVGICVPETNPDWNLNMVYCYGTMAGIRNQQSDSSRWAFFGMNSANTLQFSMVVNNVGYSCTAPSSMQTLWNLAVTTPNQFFWIGFDKTTGVCKTLSLSGGSHYR